MPRVIDTLKDRMSEATKDVDATCDWNGSLRRARSSSAPLVGVGMAAILADVEEDRGEGRGRERIKSSRGVSHGYR